MASGIHFSTTLPLLSPRDHPCLGSPEAMMFQHLTGSVSPHRAEGPWLHASDSSSAGGPLPRGPVDSPMHTAESLPKEEHK